MCVGFAHRSGSPVSLLSLGRIHMSLVAEPLKLNEVGPLGELSLRPNPNGYVVLSMPPFEAMLPFLAKRLGRELTPDEIEVQRQRAPCLVVTAEDAAKMAQARASRT